MENRNNIRGASDTGKGRYSTKNLLSGLVICGDCEQSLDVMEED